MIATTENINNSDKNKFNSSKVDVPLQYVRDRSARLQEELDWLQRRFDATNGELIALLNAGAASSGTTDAIPLSAFQNSYGVLECVCRYLANSGMPLKVIARKLNRSYSTITNSLATTKGKPFTVATASVTPTANSISLSIFSDRKVAPLQALVAYLHDRQKLRFVEIARLLKRDPRNVNATYWQARRARR